MSTQQQDDTVAVIPTTSGESTPPPPATGSPNTTTSAHLFGTIAKLIGTGENAENSIVWMTITWSLRIATGLSVVLLIFLGISFFQGKDQVVPEFTKNIISVWSIFTPIITLALGYAFGRNETK